MNYSQSYPNTYQQRRRATKLAPHEVFPVATIVLAIGIVITGFILLNINF